MVVSLEMTFLRCFFYNTLILYASAAISGYKRYRRILLISLLISFVNILMLYISNKYMFNILRLAIFCLLPVFALGKSSINKTITVISVGIIFCGSALILSQATSNIYIHFAISSITSLAACGILPVIKRKSNIKRTTIKISRGRMRPISAFIDTGITCSVGLVVVLEKSCASSILTNEELGIAMRPENLISVGTVGLQNAGLPYVDISDLCVYIPRKIKILPARIMLTDSMLPYEALISAANELEAAA